MTNTWQQGPYLSTVVYSKTYTTMFPLSKECIQRCILKVKICTTVVYIGALTLTGWQKPYHPVNFFSLFSWAWNNIYTLYNQVEQPWKALCGLTFTGCSHHYYHISLCFYSKSWSRITKRRGGRWSRSGESIEWIQIGWSTCHGVLDSSLQGLYSFYHYFHFLCQIQTSLHTDWCWKCTCS